MTKVPAAKVRLSGAVIAKSNEGTIALTENRGVTELHFSETAVLRSAMTKNVLKHLVKYRSASSFIEGEVQLLVGGKLWLVLREGKVRVNRPFAAGVFVLRQWLSA